MQFWQSKCRFLSHNPFNININYYEYRHKNCRGRYRLRGTEHRHAAGAASPGDGGGRHSRKGGETQQQDFSHTGRIHREVSGGEATEPEGDS